MKLIIQPKFTSTVTNRRPDFTDPRGNFNPAYQEAFGTYNRDYAIEVYFKENRRVGHKSRYSMGELAHHLMVEGQFSLSANRKGRPHKQMSVVRTNRARKYLLKNEAGYKKIWNFVKTGAARHKNWRKEIRALTEDMFIRRFARMLINQFTGKSMSDVNFYTGMQRVARKVLADLKEELLALEYPALDPTTIKKKNSDKILIETKKLFNALSVRVVPLKSTPKNRLNFGRKFVSKNAPYISGWERGVVNEMLHTRLNRGEYFENLNLDENGNQRNNTATPSTAAPNTLNEYPYSEDDDAVNEGSEEYNEEYNDVHRDRDQDVGTSYWDAGWNGRNGRR